MQPSPSLALTDRLRSHADRALAMSRRAWRVALYVCVAWLLAFSWMFPQVSAPNERTRIYLTVAMVEHGTVSIDAPMRRFGHVADRAVFEGRTYTDKAPGSSVLGVIPYGVARWVAGAEAWSIEALVQLMRWGLMVPVGVLGFALVRRLMARLALRPASVDLASLAWILGTSAFHYSNGFFGHQLVAVALLGSLECALSAIDAAESDGAARWAQALRWAGAGGCAGLAGLTEYQALVPCAMLLCFVLAHREGRRPLHLTMFVLSAGVCAAGLLGYHTAAFGGPLEISYHHLPDAAVQARHEAGIGGVALPVWDHARGAMLSLHRGLFATSPIMLAMVPGVALLVRRRRAVGVLVAAALVYYGLFVASTEVWHGNWGFGPRLLVPVLGWAMLPVACALDAALRRPILAAWLRAAALVGVLYHQAVAVVMPELPLNVLSPLTDAVWPALKRGIIGPNLGQHILGLEPTTSLAAAAPAWALVACALLVRGTRRTLAPLQALLACAWVSVWLVCVFALNPNGPRRGVEPFLAWLARMQAELYPL